MTFSTLLSRMDHLLLLRPAARHGELRHVQSLAPTGELVPEAVLLSNDLPALEQAAGAASESVVILIGPAGLRDRSLPRGDAGILIYPGRVIPLDFAARVQEALSASTAESDRAMRRRDLLDALLSGDIALGEAARSQAQQLQLALAHKGQVFVLSIETSAALDDALRGPALRADLHRVLRSTVLAASPNHEIDVRANRALGLLDDRVSPGEVHTLMQTLMTRLHDRFPARMLLGLGQRHAGPFALRDSHAEAQQALTLLRRRPGKRVWSAYAAMRGELVLGELARQPDVQRVLGEVLGPLDGLDARARHSLLATLHAYLIHNRSVQQAASSLALHPNTFKYRLRRVEELFTLRDLSPDDAFLLLLAAQVNLHEVLPGADDFPR